MHPIHSYVKLFSNHMKCFDSISYYLHLSICLIMEASDSLMKFVNLDTKIIGKFKWDFKKKIEESDGWIVTDELEIGPLKWRLLLNSNYVFKGESEERSYSALFMELRTFVDEQVRAKFSCTFENNLTIASDFKSYQFGTKWGSRYVVRSFNGCSVVNIDVIEIHLIISINNYYIVTSN